MSIGFNPYKLTNFACALRKKYRNLKQIFFARFFRIRLLLFLFSGIRNKKNCEFFVFRPRLFLNKIKTAPWLIKEFSQGGTVCLAGDRVTMFGMLSSTEHKMWYVMNLSTRFGDEVIHRPW